MKTLLTFLFFYAMPCWTFAQSISYIYDNAGNRIVKALLISSRQLDDQENKKKQTESYSDLLSKKNIRLYPNPTSGILKVEVLGFSEDDNCSLSIYSTSGQLVESTQLTSSFGVLNISSMPNGLYILKIFLNGNETCWKIIKK